MSPGFGWNNGLGLVAELQHAYTVIDFQRIGNRKRSRRARIRVISGLTCEERNLRFPAHVSG